MSEAKKEESGAISAFQADEEIVKALTNLGFSRNAIIKACFYTDNASAEYVAGWIIQNGDKNLDGPLDEPIDFDDFVEEEEPEDLYKMVLVVNTELNMGVGKIAAQCAHAALSLHRVMSRNSFKFGQMLEAWEYHGERKIVLKGDNSAQLRDLASKAQSAGLVQYIVEDAGKTQVYSINQHLALNGSYVRRAL